MLPQQEQEGVRWKRQSKANSISQSAPRRQPKRPVMNCQIIHDFACRKADRLFHRMGIELTRDTWAHWQKLYGLYCRYHNRVSVV